MASTIETMSSEDADQESESVSRCLKEDLTHSFEAVLKDFPEVLLYIKRLNEHIEKQQYTLVKLFEKLKEYRRSTCVGLKRRADLKDVSTQTEPWTEADIPAEDCSSAVPAANLQEQCSEWNLASGAEVGMSLADEVKQVAENAMQQTGFVYEETSGMYYDYNTGFYYNAEMGLYYDGNSGTYLYYDEAKKTYEYHSQATVPIVPVAPDPVVMRFTAAPILEPDVIQSTAIPLAPAKTVKTSVNVVTESRMKYSRPKVVKPDPLETKETELLIPCSNPMAPVCSESSNSSPPRQKEPEREYSKKSKKDLKRKGKHKKHKSKKKKKKRSRSHPRNEKSLEEGECSDSSESARENDSSFKDKSEEKLIKSEKSEEKVTRKDESPILHQQTDFLSSPKWANSVNKSSKKKHRRLSNEKQWFSDEQHVFSDEQKKLKDEHQRTLDETNEAWPPCMRIIVQSTEVKNLNVGTLSIVTCKGGTLGREKFHAVSIPDINISKHHGIFTFEDSTGKYFFTDYGSRNGTYVNNQRLSSAKQESEPCEISHGTIIKLGSTNLLCHVHPGRETCEECEPGVVAAKIAEEYDPLPPTSKSESKSERRIQELRRLRKRFGLESNEKKGDFLAPGYEDRAELRRVTVGSHNEHAKTEVASATESIRSTNKGFKMLAKMGWKEGESLGKDGTGLTEPVLVSQRQDKAGLGADNAFSLAPGAPAVLSKKKRDKWERARQRYGELPDTVVDAVGDAVGDE